MKFLIHLSVGNGEYCNTTAFMYVDTYINGNIMDQGEPGIDYNDNNLNPLVCDLCKRTFDSLDKLGEHQKVEHDM